jgi:hypothetical protein
VRDIAGVIGCHLNVLVVPMSLSEVDAQSGFLGRILTFDCLLSSALTQERLGWHPEQPGLLADLDQGHYFNSDK